jgi:phospholipid-translocating ATPase
LFDEHIPAERALREPQLYQYTLQGKPYRISSYWINMFDGMWQATIVFFISYYAYQGQSNYDTSSLGFSLVFSLMITSLATVLLQTSRIDWSVAGSSILSFLVYLIFTLVFDATCVACIPYESPYKVSYHRFPEARFWFTNILVFFTAMLPRFGVKCAYNTIRKPFH